MSASIRTGIAAAIGAAQQTPICHAPTRGADQHTAASRAGPVECVARGRLATLDHLALLQMQRRQLLADVAGDLSQALSGEFQLGRSIGRHAALSHRAGFGGECNRGHG